MVGGGIFFFWGGGGGWKEYKKGGMATQLSTEWGFILFAQYVSQNNLQI